MLGGWPHACGQRHARARPSSRWRAHNFHKENQKTMANRRNQLTAMSSTDSDSVVARRVALGQANSALDSASTDPDLARVLAAWPAISAPIRTAILALVASASAPSV
jgi:hypothetical protein